MSDDIFVEAGPVVESGADVLFSRWVDVDEHSPSEYCLPTLTDEGLFYRSKLKLRVHVPFDHPCYRQALISCLDGCTGSGADYMIISVSSAPRISVRSAERGAWYFYAHYRDLEGSRKRKYMFSCDRPELFSLSCLLFSIQNDVSYGGS